MRIEEDFPSPIDVAYLKWKERPNTPDFRRSNPGSRKKYTVFADLMIYPNTSEKIMIIHPGINESTNGLNGRYRAIGQRAQSEDFSATVVGPNPRLKYFLPTTILQKMINYSVSHAYSICNSPDPEIFLMGYSAGASAAAALAILDRRITKLLLISPSGDMPRELVQPNLEKFKGEVYVVIGEKDEVVDPHAQESYYYLASAAAHKELFIIPDCDHYFQDEVNDMIFKKAPFYAFAQGEKPKFP